MMRFSAFPLGSVCIVSEYMGDIREAMPDAWALGRPSRTLVTSTVFLELIQTHTMPSSRLRQTQSLNKQDIFVLSCFYS